MESLVTARFGEQDTCGVTGVTTITPAEDGRAAVIRFDLSELPKSVQVKKALLRMERMRLQAVGQTLRAWLNGQEVFPGGVKDAALKVGTAGLYAANRTVFDNVEVGPPK